MSRASTSTSPKDVRRDFERVVEKLGRVPDAPEYNDHGTYSAMEVARHFTDSLPMSYDDAVHNLGYTVSSGSRNRIPDEEVRRDFERVKAMLGHVPSKQEYMEHAEYSLSALTNKFAGESSFSYKKAVRALGYEPRNTSGVPPEEVKHDFARVVLKLGHIPSYTEYKEHGAHTPETLIRKFADGSAKYDDAVYALGYRPEEQ